MENKNYKKRKLKLNPKVRQNEDVPKVVETRI